MIPQELTEPTGKTVCWNSLLLVRFSLFISQPMLNSTHFIVLIIVLVRFISKFGVGVLA